MSPLSRNYQLGFQIGQGKELGDIVSELGQVAEGLNTLKLVKAKADELEVYMPLVSGLHAILVDKQDVVGVIAGLMDGEQNQDVEFMQDRSYE